MICSAFINIVKAAEFAVTGGRDILTGEVFGIETPGRFDEFNDFLDAFYKHVDYIIEFFIDNIDKQTALSMKINPSPVLSSTIGLCMEKGKDYFSGGMKYNNTTIKCYGLAVRTPYWPLKTVFDEKLLTHEELQDALITTGRL